jgi:hypothetical protein
MPLVGCNPSTFNHQLRELDIRSNTHFTVSIYTYASCELFISISILWGKRKPGGINSGDAIFLRNYGAPTGAPIISDGVAAIHYAGQMVSTS